MLTEATQVVAFLLLAGLKGAGLSQELPSTKLSTALGSPCTLRQPQPARQAFITLSFLPGPLLLRRGGSGALRKPTCRPHSLSRKPVLAFHNPLSVSCCRDLATLPGQPQCWHRHVSGGGLEAPGGRGPSPRTLAAPPSRLPLGSRQGGAVQDGQDGGVSKRRDWILPSPPPPRSQQGQELSRFRGPAAEGGSVALERCFFLGKSLVSEAPGPSPSRSSSWGGLPAVATRTGRVWGRWAVPAGCSEQRSTDSPVRLQPRQGGNQAGGGGEPHIGAEGVGQTCHG